MEAFFNELTGSLREILYTVAIAALGYGMVLAKSYVARIKDKTLSEALDRAVTSGAGAVINQLGVAAAQREVKATEKVVVNAAADITKSNPEGVAQFNLTHQDLQDRITKKVGVLTAPSLATEVKK